MAEEAKAVQYANVGNKNMAKANDTWVGTNIMPWFNAAKSLVSLVKH